MGKNPFSLHGKEILITGASSGIGREIAVQCSVLGAKLYITGRNQERLEETLSLLTGNNHCAIAADLTQKEDRANLVSGLNDLDGVVHSAGISLLMPLRMITEEKLKHIQEINLNAPIMLTQNLLAKRKIKNGGAFVFISSLETLYSVPGNGPYAATKAGLEGISRALASELKQRKIRSNSIAPGMIVTPLSEKSCELVGVDQTSRLEDKFPLGMGQPQDVAYASIYLLSDASRWITGQTLVMDGGHLLP